MSDTIEQRGPVRDGADSSGGLVEWRRARRAWEIACGLVSDPTGVSAQSDARSGASPGTRVGSASGTRHQARYNRLDAARVSFALVACSSALRVCPDSPTDSHRSPSTCGDSSSDWGRILLTAADLGIDPGSCRTRAWRSSRRDVLSDSPARASRWASAARDCSRARDRRPVDAEGLPLGPSSNDACRASRAELSLNFGHRDGWSYLSAGMGPLRFETFEGERAPAESVRRAT